MALREPHTHKFMARLQKGLSLNTVVTGKYTPCGKPILGLGTRESFVKHCDEFPEWGREAMALVEQNAKAARKRNGSHLRNRTHCKHGHSLLDPANVRVYIDKGWLRRRCLTCERRIPVGKMTPSEVRRVTATVKAGFTVSDITHSTPERRLIVSFGKLKRYRIEHPEFDRFIIQNARDALSRSHLLQCRVVPANKQFPFSAPTIIKPIRKEVAPYLYREGDLDWISSLVPKAMPQRDDVIQNMFMDLCARAVAREEVPNKIRTLIAEQNRLFPTKFRKFGGHQLVSLDEVLFDDGNATRGDFITRGLWD